MKEFDQFHDGYLDGLQIQGANVRIFLRADGGQEFVLEVSGVLRPRADGFREGNIIFDVLVRNGDDITVHDIIDCYGFKEEANALTKLEELRRKNPVVLEINPSYGASCTILAESVELFPRP
jgi:hypothetical protein